MMPTIILAFIVAIVLEYYLAKKKNKVVGLLLPGALLLTTIISIVMAKPDETVNLFQRFVQMIYALLYLNIPTYVLITIYLVVRKKENEKNS